MEFGAFSISLAVKYIATSKNFYEKLGFEVFGGDASQNSLNMRMASMSSDCSTGCSRGTS